MKEKNYIEYLYKEYYNYLSFVIKSNIYEQAEADACLQEVFITIHKKKDELKDIENTKAWLRKTAIFHVKNFNRNTQVKNKHISYVEQSYLVELENENAIYDGIENQIIDNMIFEKLLAFIYTRLSEQEKYLFQHKVLDKKATKTLSAETNIPVFTINTKVRRLKTKVAAIISEFYEENELDLVN